MNRKMIISILSKLLIAEALIMLLPTFVSVYYKESPWPFIIVIAALLLLGGLGLLFSPKDQTIYIKEGFMIVGLVWIMWSLAGAVPFTISGAIPNFIDAVFETVSGFTTTGSSVITNLDVIPKSIIFWRSLTHWIGGMGVLVFVLAILPMSSGRGMYIMRAEMPGPSVDKLVPKTADTAKILYLIYIVLTTILIGLLFAGGMPLFDSCLYAFGTAGTGGFSISNAGIAGYGSSYIEIVITVFMLLFGVNFNLFYLILIGKVRQAFKNTEFLVYAGIFVLAASIITVNTLGLFADTGDGIKTAAFQVASVMSSTGFATADFAKWPYLSQSVLLILMFIGACAGSTGGGMKVIRLVILCKATGRDIAGTVRPREIKKVRIDKRCVEEETINGVKAYMLLYFSLIFLSFIVLSFEGKDILTTFSSVVTCFNNIGPGLGELVGPMGNFSGWSAFSKIILSIDMLFGRLEIFPIILLFMPAMWKKKSL